MSVYVCEWTVSVCNENEERARVNVKRQMRTASISNVLASVGHCTGRGVRRVGGLRHGPAARNQAAKFRVPSPGTPRPSTIHCLLRSRFGSRRPAIVRRDGGHRIVRRHVAQVTAALHRSQDIRYRGTECLFIHCLYIVMFIDTKAASYHRHLSECSRHTNQGRLTAR